MSGHMYVDILTFQSWYLATADYYADDVLLYKAIRSDEDFVSLQSDLGTLQEWADDWQMRFKVLKCQHISFYNKQVQTNFNYMICNEVIRQVDSIKYVGVTINKKIT